MKVLDLWRAAEQCIVNFEALPETACVTEDEHLTAFTAPLTRAGKLSDEEATFIRETSTGFLRYRDFIQATVDGFCAAKKKNKQNSTTVGMIFYFILFRFEELGASAFRSLVSRTLSNNRIAEILELCLDNHDLETHLVPRWCTVFDDAYVHRHVLGMLRRISPALQDVAEFFRTKASGIATHSSRVAEGATASESVLPEKQQLSRAVGFSFLSREHKRKPQLPPHEVRVLEEVGQREEFPRIKVKCTDAERCAVELAAKGIRGASTLDPEIRQRNRQRESKLPFREFTATARPAQLPRLVEEQRKREEEACRPLTTGRPGPEEIRARAEQVRERVAFRQNDAALQREYSLYKRREEERERARTKKEQEMRDDTEFRQWRAKMEANDEVRRMEMVAQRKAELLAGDEAARATRRRQQEANLRRTRKDKIVTDAWREECAQRNLQQLASRRQHAERLREAQSEAVQQVKDDLQAERIANAADVRDESRRRNESVAVQLELEKQRKQALIEEIKAAHRAFVQLQQHQRTTLAERTVNSSLTGALDGMSIADLRAKLAAVRADHERRETSLRESIARDKASRRNITDARRQYVEDERARSRSQKQLEHSAKLARMAEGEETERRREDQLAINLQRKLECQRDEKQREKRDRVAAERQRRVAAQLLSADAGAIEAQKWAEIERGKQNALVHAQNSSLKDRQRMHALHKREEAVREKNLHDVEVSHREVRNATDTTFAEKRRRVQREQAEDDTVRLAATRKMMEEARTVRVLASSAGM